MSPPEETAAKAAEIQVTNSDTNFELGFLSTFNMIAGALMMVNPIPSSFANWWESPLYSAFLLVFVITNIFLGVLAFIRANNTVRSIWLFSLVFTALSAFKVIPLG